MILPVTVVAIQTIGQYSRYTRASVPDVSSSDFLRTARSKGIPERRVLWRHSVRNAMIPIVTIVALDIGTVDRRPDHHREHLQLSGHGRLLHPGRRRSATSRASCRSS